LLWSADVDARNVAGASISLRRSSKRVSPTENSVQLALRRCSKKSRTQDVARTSDAGASAAHPLTQINNVGERKIVGNRKDCQRRSTVPNGDINPNGDAKILVPDIEIRRSST
jgi:hypothetical protein